MKRQVVVYKGIKFYRYPESKNLGTRNYFKAVLILHREIYKDFHGPLPEGMHVHHKDENPLNNAPDNLEALIGKEHNRLHAIGRSHWRKKSIITCKTCGKACEKSHSNKKREADFCSPLCCSRAATKASRKPIRKINCATCGREFETHIKKQKCCSKKCIMKWHNHKDRRKRGK
jgi:hypothetical protein